MVEKKQNAHRLQVGKARALERGLSKAASGLNYVHECERTTLRQRASVTMRISNSALGGTSMRSTCVTGACSVRGSRAAALCDPPPPSWPPATWAFVDAESLAAASMLATPAATVFAGLLAFIALLRESGDERPTFGCSGRLSGCDAGEAGTRDEAVGANGEPDSALLHAAATSIGVAGCEQQSGLSNFVDFVERVVVVLVLRLGLLGGKNGTANAYDEAAVSSPRPLSAPATRCSSGTWPMPTTGGVFALSSMLASGETAISGRLSISN